MENPAKQMKSSVGKDSLPPVCAVSASTKDGRTDQGGKSLRLSNDRQQQPLNSLEGRDHPQWGPDELCQTGSRCLGCIYFVIKIISNNIKREDPFFFIELTPTFSFAGATKIEFLRCTLGCPRSSRTYLICWEYCSHQKAHSLRAVNKTGELGRHRSEEAKGGL